MYLVMHSSLALFPLLFLSLANAWPWTTTCDENSRIGDPWMRLVEDDLSHDDSLLTKMFQAMFYPEVAQQFPQWNCDLNGNSQRDCTSVYENSFYKFTIRKTSASGTYNAQEGLDELRMVRGYCVGSRQPDDDNGGLNKNLGSGTSQDQASDLKVETKIETKLLPLACSSIDLTQEQKDNNAADQRALAMMLRSVCGVGGCGEFFDKPRCERLIRSGENYSMQVIAQNYGKSYDLANCAPILGEIVTRCFAKGKQGGAWGIGEEKPGSQEYYELNFPAAVHLDHVYHDTL